MSMTELSPIKLKMSHSCGGEITMERERVEGVGVVNYYICEHCGIFCPDGGSIKSMKSRQQLLFAESLEA